MTANASTPPRPITAAAVADAGRVRLGAGIRAAAARPAPRPAPSIPAAVADAGRVRLGAGIRRA